MSADAPGRLVLVRHGETAWSARGEADARARAPLPAQFEVSLAWNLERPSR